MTVALIDVTWPDPATNEGAGIVVTMDEAEGIFMLQIADGATAITHTLTRPHARNAWALFRDGGKQVIGTGQTAVARGRGIVVTSGIVGTLAQLVAVMVDPADLDTLAGYIRDLGLQYYGNFDDVPVMVHQTRELARLVKRRDAADLAIVRAQETVMRKTAERDALAAALAEFGAGA